MNSVSTVMNFSAASLSQSAVSAAVSEMIVIAELYTQKARRERSPDELSCLSLGWASAECRPEMTQNCRGARTMRDGQSGIGCHAAAGGCFEAFARACRWAKHARGRCPSHRTPAE